MKSFRKTIGKSLLAVTVICLLAFTAWAQDAPTQDESTQSDPPGRVARLDYMNGQVSVQPQGSGDWIQGDTNRPLTNGDNVWADKDSKAELSFGTARARIDSLSSLTLTNVGDNAIQLSLHQGALNVHVARLESGEIYEIDTPNIAFTVDKPGDYRFDVDSNADTTLATVWKGGGDAAESDQPAVHISSGQQVSFTGGNSPGHEVQSAPQPDAFDQWCQLRDKREDNSVSAKYVNPGVVGSDDLDQYGTWTETPDYGPVWAPSDVYPGWAPYTYGQWSYIGPWGWTWVDAYPWGFAPFHYGRWVWWNGGWGWAPGPYWGRPWYAPALVAWWGGPGWGAGFGFGFGFGGGFGWCPLGYGEPFFPWYHTSRFYFRNINIRNTRITNINRVSNNYFRNGGRTPLYGRGGLGMPRFATAHNALTAMSRTNLERGMAVRGNSVRVTPAQFKGASPVGRLNANPSRQAVLGAHSGAAARPSSSAFSRPTVSRMNPAARPGSFAANRTQTTAARPEARTGNIAGRSVARPQGNSGMSPSRVGNQGAAMNRNVPRPPGATFGGARGGNQVAINHQPGFAGSRGSSIPRPSEGGLGRSSSSRGMPAPSGAMHGGFNNNVPRPTGRVMPAPRENYGGARGGYGAGSRGGYSSRAYGGYPAGEYGSSRFGGFPRGGSYGGSAAPSRSYGGYHGSSGGGYHASPGGSGGYHGSSGGFHGGGGGGFHGGGGGFHGGGGGGSHGGGGHR